MIDVFPLILALNVFPRAKYLYAKDVKNEFQKYTSKSTPISRGPISWKHSHERVNSHSTSVLEKDHNIMHCNYIHCFRSNLSEAGNVL